MQFYKGKKFGITKTEQKRSVVDSAGTLMYKRPSSLGAAVVRTTATPATASTIALTSASAKKQLMQTAIAHGYKPTIFEKFFGIDMKRYQKWQALQAQSAYRQQYGEAAPASVTTVPAQAALTTAMAPAPVSKTTGTIIPVRAEVQAVPATAASAQVVPASPAQAAAVRAASARAERAKAQAETRAARARAQAETRARKAKARTLKGYGLGAYIQPPSQASQAQFLEYLNIFETEAKRMTDLTELFTYNKLLDLIPRAAIYNATLPTIGAYLNAEKNRWLSDRALGRAEAANDKSLATIQNRMLVMVAGIKKAIANAAAAATTTPAAAATSAQPQVVTVLVEKPEAPVEEKKEFPIGTVAVIGGAGIGLLLALKAFKIL